MTRLLSVGVSRSDLEPAIPDGFHFRAVATVEEALAALASWTPDVVLCGLPPLDAADVSRVAARSPKIGLVVDDVRPAILTLAYEIEALSVIRAPIHRQDLLRLVAGDKQADEAKEGLPSGSIVGESAPISEVCSLIALAARSDVNVLVTGETGTGKELVARAIHRLSNRRDHPFVAVSCAALPETLLESELFGHERGAFTGANATHAGRFERADKGSLFLDEVGELPEGMQVKLLRVLQERQVERLGSSKSTLVDVRVIAATNADLAAAADEDRFRRDLLYRLNVFCIRVPPLRDRMDDVEPLWTHFVRLAAKHEGLAALSTTPEVFHRLHAHHWPGNVRELENVARHAALLSHGRPIALEHLPAYLQQEPAKLHRVAIPSGLTLKELERELILDTYRRTKSVKEAANTLDISVRKLYYRLKEYRAEGWIDEEVPVKGKGPKARIILAEDNDDVRVSLAQLLTDEGYEVVAVPNALELVNHLGPEVLLQRRGLPGDAIVTDLRMPLMDGFQLLQSARAHGWNIPVIVISAYADAETRAKAKDLGVTAFLEKPLDLEKLQRVLDEAVQKNSALPM